MSSELRSLLDQLEPDPWRGEVGFSPEVEQTNQLLFDRAHDPEAALTSWLQKHQPCLFGKVAAKLGLLRYCILRDEDLSSDESTLDAIQSARQRWTNDAFEGKASGFVILMISERLAKAIPNRVTELIAHRVCSLYLREIEVRADAIHQERVWLEKPGPAKVTWEWLAGVNYFCAQGDKRWWQDHRIPGGLAFSVNSVGHLARSARISELMAQLNKELGVSDDEFAHGTVRSLEDALVYAMRTIDVASNAVSGKATELLPGPSEEEGTPLPPCPVKLPGSLASKNYCTYRGWYHTDYTLPSEYFMANVTRPPALQQHHLDFTYLFWRSIENPAFETMGAGRRIRTGIMDETAEDFSGKQNRMIPREIRVGECPRLLESVRRLRAYHSK